MIEYRDSEKFNESNLLRMDQASKSKGSKESSQEVSCTSQRCPQRVDPY